MSTGTDQFVCPFCLQQLTVADAEPEQMVACPLCGNEFSIPAADSDSADSTAVLDDHLDSSRIRQFSQIRRSTYRSRSYAIIAAAACCVVVAQLGVMLIRELLATGWGIWPIAYILGAAVAVYGAWRFIGRAMELNREMSRSLMETKHAVEPDFSHLSDGSQRAGNLEQIR